MPVLLRDASVFGWASASGAALGVAQFFLLPKLLDVRLYGLYRLFALYGGYVGLLHLGGVDGALLRWAGHPLGAIVPEWRVTMRWLLGWQLILCVIAGIVAAVFKSSAVSATILALGVFALAGNATTLSMFALQSGRRFRSAGAAFILPNALFLAAIAVLPSVARRLPQVLALAVAAQVVTAILLALRLLRRHAAAPAIPGRLSIGRLIAAGAPLNAANLLGGVAQTVDRLLVSWFEPVTLFASYAFAASAFFAANTVTVTLARVALPHVAAAPRDERSAVLATFGEMILCLYAVGAAIYPAFEHVVAAVLPAYASALPIVRALLPGTFFWVSTQVLTGTALQAADRVRVQLVIAAGLVAAGVVGAGSALLLHAPLWGVALATSAGTAIVWAVGAATLFRIAPEHLARGTIWYALRGAGLVGVAVAAAALIPNVVAATLVTVTAAGVVLWRAVPRLRSHTNV